jgi:hypothetical protein
MRKKGDPKWDYRDDYLAGLKSYELAQEFRAAVEPRLPGGLLDALKKDLDALEAPGEENQSKVARVRGFTSTQEQAAEKALLWCSTVREALKRGRAPTDVKKAAGVGMNFSRGKVEAVVASARTVQDAYARFPEAFRAVGVLPADMKNGERLASALIYADLNQETEKVKKTQTTSARNALRKRIEDAVDRIRAAGLLQYNLTQPATAARFTALVPPKHQRGGGNDTLPPTPEIPKA